jgi:hypothetical protein
MWNGDSRLKLLPPFSRAQLLVVTAMPDLLVTRLAASAPKAEQGLEGSPRLPAPVGPEDELIEVDLELPAADSVVSAQEPPTAEPARGDRRPGCRTEASRECGAKSKGGRAMGLAGKWRITQMDLWDREAIDLVGPAFIELGKGQSGRTFSTSSSRRRGTSHETRA